MRATLVVALLVAACGRTDLINEAVVDSRVVKDPLSVFVWDGSSPLAA